MNLYAYVHNDPLIYTDPTGMQSWGIPRNHDEAMRLRAASMSSPRAYPFPYKEYHNAAGNISKIAGIGAVICAVICQPAAPLLGGISLEAGLAEAASSQNPGAAVGIELITMGFGNKIEAVGEAVKAAGKVTDKVADATTQAASMAAGEKIKDSINNSGTNSADTSNRDNGTSGGIVEVCSGMGAQKEC